LVLVKARSVERDNLRRWTVFDVGNPRDVDLLKL
jgi:hypothetical protein